MRRNVITLAIVALALASPAADATTNLAREVAHALKLAREANRTAHQALSAVKPGPAGAAGTAGVAGARGADGGQGPAGATGAKGADGAQGPAGPQGTGGLSPIGYAHVMADGVTLDTARTSANVTMSKPANTSGIYCFHVAGATIHNAVAATDTADTQPNGATVAEVRMPAAQGCGAGFEVSVHPLVAGAGFSDAGFFVTLD